MKQCNDLVALVTGASRGIGQEICTELVKLGYRVVGCGRNLEAIENLSKSQPVSQYPGELYAIKCDVSKESDVLNMFKEIKRKYGRVDICINNAGMITTAPLMNGNVDDWKATMEVNVLGTCICSREAIKLMKEKNIAGTIVQMGCIGGYKIATIPRGTPDPGVSIYNGTKFMVRAVSESLRQELKSQGSRIRVSTITAGPVYTEVLKKAKTAYTAPALPDASECLNADEVAAAVVYVLSAPGHLNIDVVIEHVAYHV